MFMTENLKNCKKTKITYLVCKDNHIINILMHVLFKIFFRKGENLEHRLFISRPTQSSTAP